jgi:hypothetical protein
LIANVDGSTEGVTWTSQNISVATIDQNGLVTGIAPGVVLIKAISVEDASVWAAKEIVVSAKVEKVASWADVPSGDLYAGGAAIILKTQISNLTGSETITYSWSEDAARVGVLASYSGEDGWQYFTPTTIGDTTISVKVTIDGVDQTISTKIKIRVDTASAASIAVDEPADLAALLQTSGTIVGNYYLTANLDMSGVTWDDVALSNNFVGNFDGQGHTIDNLTIDSTGEMNGGMFRNFNGAIVDTEIYATLNTTAWSGIIGGNIGETTVIQNCLFDADFEGSAETAGWQFNGAIAGVVTGSYITNNVIVDGGTYGETNHHHFAVTAYMNGTPTIFDNYTNAIQTASPHDSSNRNNDRVSPLDSSESGQGWVGTFDLADNVTGNIDFDTANASTYSGLDSTIWTLADGAMPTLAHHGETLVVSAPALSVVASTTDLTVGGTSATITATVKNTSQTATYTFEGSAGYDTYISVAQIDNVFTVTPVAAGAAGITIKATLADNTVVTASEVTFTVIASGSYSIPDGATEIKDKATFLAYFDGSAAHNSTNAYLSADIDLEATNIASLGQAGSFGAIFEGCGHKIFDYSANMPFFNLVGSTAQIRNVNFVISDFTNSGFGGVSYDNEGLFKNVDVDVTLASKAINSFGACSFFGNATAKFVDCDASFVINVAGCNTIFAIARADGAIYTDCTYTVSGTAADASTVVIASAASGVTLIA